MKVIFFLKQPAARIEWPIQVAEGQSFNFPMLCKAIRADGYFLSNETYVSADNISMMAFDPEDGKGTKPISIGEMPPVLQ